MPRFDTSWFITNSSTTTASTTGTYAVHIEPPRPHVPVGSPPPKPAKKTFDPIGLDDAQYRAMALYVDHLNQCATVEWDRAYIIWKYGIDRGLARIDPEPSRQAALRRVPSADARIYDLRR